MQIAPLNDFWSPNVGVLSWALLVVRLVFGLAMSAHGAQKLFGWFGGYGVAGTGGFFEQLGFRPGRVFAAVAGMTEFASGLFIALGFLGPVGPALMISVMLVAAVTVHWPHGFFAANNGIELNLLYAMVGVMLAFTGPGLISLDAVLGLRALWSPSFAAVALAVGVVGGVANLAARRQAPVAV